MGIGIGGILFIIIVIAFIWWSRREVRKYDEEKRDGKR